MLTGWDVGGPIPLVRAKLQGASEHERMAYGLLQFNAALAENLERTADEVKAAGDAEEAPLPDDRVTQRALDVQDGRVLYLLKLAHDAFRHARNHDATILLPDLGSVQRLYETRSRDKAAGDATPATTTTPATTPAATPG